MPPKLVFPPDQFAQFQSEDWYDKINNSSRKGGKGKSWGGKGNQTWNDFDVESALLALVPTDPVGLSLAVENFLTANQIDEEASNALRLEGQEIQRQVIAKDMTGAKNPSYTLLGRILKAKNQTPADQVYFSHDPPELVKQKKLAYVYGCSIEEAVYISQKGKTSMCKNFKTGSCSWGAKCAFAHSQDELPEGRAEVETFIKDHGLEGNVAKFLLSQNVEVQKMVMLKGGVDGPIEHKSTQFMGRIRDAVWCFENGVTGPDPAELEIFIAESKLDEKAAAMMRNVGAPIQVEVMRQGALPIAQNPSAACVKRIQDAKIRFRDQMKYGITSPAPPVHSPAAPGLGAASSSAAAAAALAPTIAQHSQIANVALALQSLQAAQGLQAALQQQQQQQQQPALAYQQQASSVVGLQPQPNPLAGFSGLDPSAMAAYSAQLAQLAAAAQAAQGIRFTPY